MVLEYFIQDLKDLNRQQNQTFCVIEYIVIITELSYHPFENRGWLLFYSNRCISYGELTLPIQFANFAADT